jgi:hypothetical protein
VVRGGWSTLFAGEDGFGDIVVPDFSVLHVAERGPDLHVTRLAHHVTQLFLPVARVGQKPAVQRMAGQAATVELGMRRGLLRQPGHVSPPAVRTVIQGRSLIRSGLPKLHPAREGDRRAEVRLLSVGVEPGLRRGCL